MILVGEQHRTQLELQLNKAEITKKKNWIDYDKEFCREIEGKSNMDSCQSSENGTHYKEVSYNNSEIFRTGQKDFV